MREIKFRAWFENELLSHEQLIDMDQETHAMYTCITNEEQEDGVVYMQYTGLKVNGDIELYEGDIVPLKSSVYFGWKQGREHFKANAVVVYDEKEMRYRFLAYTKDYGKQYIDFDKSIRQSYKIIGNIYENPELLAGEQNAI
ncbi:YopX family protein [Lysinibacillus sp. 54212]|uniref:YopX family protein n=1 Tax=Lysinibacillus sp. 54212 TaxID=3119829 RepID=UPI002FC7EFFE